MSTITNLATTYYNNLPNNTAHRIGMSFLGSFAMKTLNNSTWCDLTDSLAAGATGAMFAIFSSAVEPLLTACFSKDAQKTQAFWVAKCVIGLAATTYAAPALAALVGIELKVNIAWTATLTIFQLARRVWDGNTDYSNSPYLYLASVAINDNDWDL